MTTLQQSAPLSSSVSTLNYPRTGKRGVPQQFARRLYEMLQKESELQEKDADYPKIIYWSGKGTAFGISDVAAFSSTILGKYFRTNKFSSFQRNLNLYGFSKVRRGPETDMYAHPSFVRDQPENLSQLRKLNTTSCRHRASDKTINKPKSARSVSPSPTRMLSTQFHAPLPRSNVSEKQEQQAPRFAPIERVPISPEQQTVKIMEPARIPKRTASKGCLDLLAFAMEQCESAPVPQQQ